MPLVSLTVKFFGQQVHTRFEKIQDFFAQITARAQENFTGVRVVRAYAQEPAEIAAFSTLNRQYAERNLSLVKIDALMRPLMQFLIGIGFVLIIWAGVPFAVRGEITVGQFTVFNMYLFRLIWPLIALGYVVNLYQRSHYFPSYGSLHQQRKANASKDFPLRKNDRRQIIGHDEPTISVMHENSSHMLKRTNLEVSNSIECFRI